MKYKIILILIFLLSFMLRFWQLGVNPGSIDWDEASLGYNAYSILKTGRDEYGNFLPLSIRSFGDYKPPLYTYLTVLSVYMFGLNEFSTRFFSALLGFLTIISAYFLLKELFPLKNIILYLFFLLFFAVSPWHLQFSRVAFEANIALFFLVTGILFFLKGIKKNWYFLLSSLSFALSIYSYHSPRLIVPLIFLELTIIYRQEIKKRLGFFILSTFFLFLLVLPIIKEFSSLNARFGSVSVINPDEKLGASIKAIEYDQRRGDVLGKFMHNRRIIYAREILGGYLDHFNIDFLFLTGDSPGRHHAVGMGMLYLWDAPFIILGIFYLLKKVNKETKFIFLWFLTAPIASAFTTGTPHAVRALFYLPIYQIFTAWGLIRFIDYLKANSRKLFLMPIVVFTFSFFIFNFYYYLHMYYVHTPVEYAEWWQYGYKELIGEINKLKPNNKKIIITYHYDQPYIYVLFYNKIDPNWYQQNWGKGEILRAERKFGNYELRNLNWLEDQKLTNVILVGTEEEIPKDAQGFIKNIYFPNGNVAFRIIER